MKSKEQKLWFQYCLSVTQFSSQNSIPLIGFKLSLKQSPFKTARWLLVCNPSKPDCIVVACSPPWSDWELVFCRIGDTHWTRLEMRDEGKHLLGFTCHKNSVHTVNSKREVSVYDLQTLTAWTYPSKIKYNSADDRINDKSGC